MQRKHVAVVLSGCGYLDGSEIRESVLALWALERHGAHYTCYAPDQWQYDVIDHLTREPVHEMRHALKEAARIARGAIRPLDTLVITEHDALVMPGGYGAAKTLSTLAVDDIKGQVLPLLANTLLEAVSHHIPIGAICIAPAIVAAALHGKYHATLTLGRGDPRLIVELGHYHVPCDTEHCVVDHTLRIVSTPAYMHDASLDEVAKGIEALVQAVLSDWPDTKRISL